MPPNIAWPGRRALHRKLWTHPKPYDGVDDVGRPGGLDAQQVLARLGAEVARPERAGAGRPGRRALHRKLWTHPKPYDGVDDVGRPGGLDAQQVLARLGAEVARPERAGAGRPGRRALHRKLWTHPKPYDGVDDVGRPGGLDAQQVLARLGAEVARPERAGAGRPGRRALHRKLWTHPKPYDGVDDVGRPGGLDAQQVLARLGAEVARPERAGAGRPGRRALHRKLWTHPKPYDGVDDVGRPGGLDAQQVLARLGAELTMLAVQAASTRSRSWRVSALK
ncbi:hypothetical protein PYW08_006618 [Mythimna loreyi]|uniref:Uncharacterized protein n=1 Tax=Mythimna loreyi TaxID=667449 RepID=A0ACC2RB89_9NEOP|nr:hypothetical protein PYW08_006618 [Mythimna loreyi]